MQNIIRKKFLSANNIVLSYLIIGLVFILDLLTPLGYAVWILYLIPLHIAPYQSLNSRKIYLPAGLCSVLIWTGFFLDSSGIPASIALFNRILMTVFYWVVAYSQKQKYRSFAELSEKEEKLRKATEQYDLLFNSIEEGFAHFRAVYDRAGIITDIEVIDINPAAAALTGISREEQIGKTVRETQPGIDEKWFEMFRTVERTGNAAGIEYFSGITSKWYLYNLTRINPGQFAAAFFDITDRKIADVSLKQSEERFRLLAEGLSKFIIVWTADPEGNIDFRLGENWQKYNQGLSKNRKGWEWISGLHPDDVQETLEVWHNAVTSGEPYQQLMRIRNNDGQYRWTLTQAKAMKDASGNVLKWYGTSTDVHDQKILEDKLKTALDDLTQNQLRFERAEQLAHVGSWVMDADTGEMKLSAEMVKLVGLPSDTTYINIREYLKFVHPDDVKRVRALSSEYHREGRPLDIEYRIIRSDGQIRYVRGISSSDKLDARKHIRYGAAQDITERKLVEIQLSKIQTQLIEAQKLAHIGNFSVNYNENGNVEWSEEMFRIYERDMQTGAPSVDEALNLIHPEDRDNVVRMIRSSKNEKKTTECVYRIITHKKKIKYLHSIFSPVFDSSGSLIEMFGTSLDVTENMKQQKTIRDTLRKLQRSNKELEQFAYVASHDLQEPLRMVSSYMGMLEKKYMDQLDSRARQFIHFAVDGSKRMGSLIRDLLVYSRISSQAREFSAVDMNKVFRDAVHDLQVLIKGKNAAIEKVNLPAITADPTQMHQLFLNLIGNAIKFHGQNNPEVFISSEEIENGWIFTVRDNGIGIENVYYDRIFQVFQRLHDREKYSGTGIGLAVCQKIVERHGGRIWVESEVGKGTTFYFTISKNPDTAGSHKTDSMGIYSERLNSI